MDFDLKFCLAYLKGQDAFFFKKSKWEISINNNTHEILVFCPEWVNGKVISVLFTPSNSENDWELKLCDAYYEFRDINMINNDITYKVLSTIATEYSYKLALYAVMKYPKSSSRLFLNEVKTDTPIYERLAKLISMYEHSSLLYKNEN